MNASVKEGWAGHTSLVVLTLVLISLPGILPSRMMAAEILIMSFPTLAFIMLLGYTGLLSFCTGSLFAVGAYTAGLLVARFDLNVLLAILAGVILTGVVASIIGYLCIRQGGLIFALLTLAFNQIIWFVIWQWKSVTGGPDGIWGIQRSAVSVGFLSVSIKSSFNFYIFVLVFFLLGFLFAKRLIESPFGKVLQGLRDSELRAIAIGYNPISYKWVSFVITGMMCGLGGSLFALHQCYVGEHLANWMMSGEIVIMGLLGGIFSLYGAIVGSGIFVLLTDFLNRFPVLTRSGAWLLILGAVFIAVVMFLRGGICGGVELGYKWLRSKSALRPLRR